VETKATFSHSLFAQSPAEELPQLATVETADRRRDRDYKTDKIKFVSPSGELQITAVTVKATSLSCVYKTQPVVYNQTFRVKEVLAVCGAVINGTR